MAKNKRLGRGLSALITSTTQEEPKKTDKPAAPARETSNDPFSDAVNQARTQAPPEELELQANKDEVTVHGPPPVSSRSDIQAQMVNTAAITPNPYQPRTSLTEDSIDALARSVAQSGILQPITVRVRGDHFEIVAGERRWRAAQKVGLHQVPVIVRRVPDDQMLELALVENIQREDLNAIDRALAYQQYCRRFDKKPEEVARRVGEDRSTVVNFLRLLDLPDEVKDFVAQGTIKAGHARCLLGLPNQTQMTKLAREIIKEGLSVRAVEERVRKLKADSADPQKAAQNRQQEQKSVHIRDLEARLENACGTKVAIQESRKKGKGKIILEYYTLDDFERLTSRLGLKMND